MAAAHRESTPPMGEKTVVDGLILGISIRLVNGDQRRLGCIPVELPSRRGRKSGCGAECGLPTEYPFHCWRLRHGAGDPPGCDDCELTGVCDPVVEHHFSILE